MSFFDLFKSEPQPIKRGVGLYECRRCKQRFEEPECNPCPANMGSAKMVGGRYYWRLETHVCEASRPDRQVYGLADLVGSTVTIEYPTTVEIPGA